MKIIDLIELNDPHKKMFIDKDAPKKKKPYQDDKEFLMQGDIDLLMGPNDVDF